ncbi:solute carrier family 25 member 40-like, partial [Limulus polyphemus]|uniref:Solute carrier family 25 member 40-like n=1 Tax=Limulus polyphemus TaxID=6850 RepID=A0ABM1C2L0_LIMPO
MSTTRFHGISIPFDPRVLSTMEAGETSSNRIDFNNNGKITTNLTPFQQMASSCTGALVTSVFVNPLDVVKIRLQAQQKEFMRNKCFLYCNDVVENACFCVSGTGTTSSYLYKHPRYFSGTLDAFIKITRTEGKRSLWSGLPTTLVMAVPATVIYFTLYDQLRAYLLHHSNASKQALWVPMLAGAAARVIAVTVISPLELIRTKMQSKKLSYS